MPLFAIVVVAALGHVSARTFRSSSSQIVRDLNASTLADVDDVVADYNATAEEVANAIAEMKNGETLAQSAVAEASQTPRLNATVNSTVEAPFENGTISAVASASGAVTFQSWYASHTTGRGIWKWNNALAAYQRHFTGWAGYPVSVAEVGVQSGGSISMWQAVLGAKCYVHGLDINKACLQFKNARTSITIGDQADPNMWHNFFVAHPKLNLLVDDGGHEAHQMLTTLMEVFWKLQPGGAIAIEDIHGEHYVKSFFTPSANYLGHMHNRGKVESVHVYPFLLIAQRAGKAPSGLPTPWLRYHPTNRIIVNTFADMWTQIRIHRGGVVVLKNAKWGSFLSAKSLTSFFAHFQGLHKFDMFDTPPNCHSTASPNCVTTAKNSPTQTLVSGVHIYKNELYVEVTPSPPAIMAVRKGNNFIKYG